MYLSNRAAAAAAACAGRTPAARRYEGLDATARLDGDQHGDAPGGGVAEEVAATLRGRCLGPPIGYVNYTLGAAERWQPLLPVPPGVPPPPPGYLLPHNAGVSELARWPYHDENGLLLGAVVLLGAAGTSAERGRARGRTALTLTYCRDDLHPVPGEGACWQYQAFPPGRTPLYRLDALAAYPDLPVLV